MIRDRNEVARLERWALPLALAVVALGYTNALDAGFVWDDHSLIEQQDTVKKLAPLHTYFGQMFWSDPLDLPRSFYRPLITISYAVDHAVWDGQPAGFHLTNLLLHLGVVTLVFFLCRRAGARPASSALAAALFGTFPRLTESVTWVSGRTDVLASLFGFGAVLAYSTRPQAWPRRVLAGLLLLLGLLCKEVAVVTLIVIASQERTALQSGKFAVQRSLLHLAPVLGVVAVYGLLRFALPKPEVRWKPPSDPLEVRIVDGIAAIGHYFRMLVDSLRPQTQIGAISEHPLPMILLGVFVLISAPWLLWRHRRTLGTFRVALFCSAAAALAMVLHVIPLDVNVLAADRFLYVPMALLVVALPFERWLARWPLPVVASGLIVIAAFGGAVHARNHDWKDDRTFWTQALTASGSERSLPAMQMALLLMDEGLYERALGFVQLSIATDVRETSIAAKNNEGVCKSRLGAHPEAISIFQRIIDIRPAAYRARYNLAISYARALRFDQSELALFELERLLPAHPALPEYRKLLARVREKWASLPSQVPGEPAEITYQRALLYEDLTATYEAAQQWTALLGKPDFTRDQLLRATGTLVYNHDVESAQRAVDLLREKYPETPELPELQAHLESKKELLKIPL